MNSSKPSLADRAAAVLELRRRGVLPRPPRLSFRAYVDLVRPDYEWNDHHIRAADLLEQARTRHIRRLMLLEPVRHGKSELASRLFPAYVLYCDASEQVAITAASAGLAQSFSRAAREFYREGGGVLAEDSRAVGWWHTPSGGGLWAQGIGGSIVGRGFGIGIIDDPIRSREMAMSQGLRDKQWHWYQSEFSTRQAPNAAIIMPTTRWHGDDLAGRVLRHAEATGEVWHVLHLPAIKEIAPSYPASAIVYEDDRAEGEALWPSRFSLAELAARRADSDTWFPLYQQTPSAQTGAIFDKAWWNIATGRNRYVPEDGRLGYGNVTRWLFVDTAQEDGAANDRSAVAIFDLFDQAYDHKLALRHVWQGKLRDDLLPQHLASLFHVWNYDGRVVGVVLEKKGSGALVGRLTGQLLGGGAGVIKFYTPKVSKIERARVAAQFAAYDMILFPYANPANASWYADFIGETEPEGELWRFPYAAYDDATDAFTSAPNYLQNFLLLGRQQIVQRMIAQERAA